VLSAPDRARSEETLETGKNREVGFRLGNVAGTIYILAKRADLRRAMLGALAASRFGAHPEVNLVQVNIEEWVMPTMADYRVGVRPRWRSLLDATFVRNPRTSRGEMAPLHRSLVPALVPAGVAATFGGTPGGAAPRTALSPDVAVRRLPLAAW
jgi:hypothetical protein